MPNTGCKIHNLLLQVEIKSVEHRSAVREIHHGNAKVRMESGKCTGRTRRASGDLRGPADPGCTVSVKCGLRTSQRCNHAPNLTCPGGTAGGYLRRVPSADCIHQVECAHRTAMVYVNAEEIPRGYVAQEINTQHQAGSHLMLQSDVHLHRARSLIIRRQQAQTILVWPGKSIRVTDEIG